MAFPSKYINDIQFWQGYLWLATNKGLSYCIPKDLDQKANLPIITNLKGSIVSDNSNIENNEILEHNQNDVVFSFTGISFSKPKK